LTNKVHARVRRGRNAAGELERTEVDAFDDRWSSMSEYLEHLAPRLAALRDTLADHGSLVLHVDSKTSHYLKVLCDEIFGPDAFASEIIWRYRRWPAKTRNFQRVHDVLLRYVRNPQSAARFNQLYEPLAASTQATWGTRKQRAVTEASGRRVRSSSTDTPSPGAPLGDVWDIGIVAPVARERTGYPTQKPEVLLQRLITSLTDPDDLVLDPYCGSGTTLAVAHRLGRRVLGIDQGEEAREVTLTRLRAMGARPTVEECSTALAVAS
jgi:site-specific DNA-methyltransferase (adenine-specific)